MPGKCVRENPSDKNIACSLAAGYTVCILSVCLFNRRLYTLVKFKMFSKIDFLIRWGQKWMFPWTLYEGTEQMRQTSIPKDAGEREETVGSELGMMLSLARDSDCLRWERVNQRESMPIVFSSPPWLPPCLEIMKTGCGWCMWKDFSALHSPFLPWNRSQLSSVWGCYLGKQQKATARKLQLAAHTKTPSTHDLT